jgi:TP901 family phage tail tape measure protein
MQDERVRLRTEVDTDEASVSLESLKAELREVKREIKEMGEVSEEWSDEQKQAYAELRQRQSELNAEVREYTRNIDINDASMTELRARLRQLVAEQNALTAESDEWIEKSREVGEVRRRIAEVTEEANRLGGAMNDQRGILGRWKDDFIGTFAAVQLDNLVDAVADFGRESVEMAAETTDAFSDIQKSTGMTADEVNALNEDLKNVDTRSTQEALLDIVKVGGQLGVATDEVKGFTESVDKANVALGDEFSSGAEEVANTMGTLAKLFKDTKDLEAGDAINDIGSAINELGAAGSATGPVVADFTTRIGQLGDLAPEIGQTLGLGAAFQELGLSAEISAGGITNILLTASKSTNEFAQQLGISEVEMRKLINTNPNEFLLRLADSLRGVPADQVAKRLAELGITSQEATKVMSLLKDQTQLVRDRQLLANKAMQEGTSLTNEFSIKNSNAAAELAKGQKALDNFKVEIGTGLLPILVRGTQGLVALLNVVRQVPAFVRENQTAISLLVLGLVTLNANLIRAQAATLASATADKLKTVASGIAAAAERVRAQQTAAAAAADGAAATASQRLTIQERLAAAQTTASNLLTQAKIVLTNGWTVAQNALNTALRANPIGLVITVLALLAAGLVTAYKNSETFRGIVNGVWAALKVGLSTLSPITSAIESLWNLVKAGFGYWLDLQKALVGFAVDGLGNLLNRVAPVKTAISGLWNIITGGVQKIKDAANAVAEFLHIDGLVSRAKQTAQQMGTAFRDAYHKELDAARTKETADDDTHGSRKVANAKTSAKAMAAAHTSENVTALNTISKDNEKHRESEEKKAATAAKKQADEKVKANQDALTKIQDMQVAAISGEVARQEAQENLRYQREVAAVQKSIASQTLKNQQLALMEDSHQAKLKEIGDAAQKTRADLLERWIDDEFTKKIKKAQQFADSEITIARKSLTDKDELAKVEAKIQQSLDAEIGAIRAERDQKDQKLRDDKAKDEQQKRLDALTAEKNLFDSQYREAMANADLNLSLAKNNADAIHQAKLQRLKAEYEYNRQKLQNEAAEEKAKNQVLIQDADARAAAEKQIDDRLKTQLTSTDRKYQADKTTLNREHLETRQRNQKEFFDAIEGLSKGDYSSFMGLLEKKLANEKAANQKGLQDFTAKGQSTLAGAAQVVGALQSLNQKYLESQLAKITKEKNTQLANWKEQYDKGKISKEQYEKQVDKINKEAAEKEKAEKLKAWKRDQTMQIAMAIINAAQAALKSLATLGWPLGLIGVAASAVAAGIQIAMIKRQQPPSFATGGFVTNGGVAQGPAHGPNPGVGGISLINNKTGQHVGEMEGGEPIMILSKRTYRNNRPIIDKLLHSSLHRKGAPIFEQGGAFGSDGGSYSTYLKPLRPGGWYEDGTEVVDGGGGSSSSDAGSTADTSDTAAETSSLTDEQIKKSQELMEKIAKNTGDMAEQLKGLITYLSNSFLWTLQSTITGQTEQIHRSLGLLNWSLTARFDMLLDQQAAMQQVNLRTASSRHIVLVAEIEKQGNKLKAAIDQSQNRQLLQNLFNDLAEQNRHRELLTQLDRLAQSAIRAQQEQFQRLLTQNNLLQENDQLIGGLRHMAMLAEIRKQFTTLLRSDGQLSKALIDELKLDRQSDTELSKAQHETLIGELQKLFRALLENDDVRSENLLTEMNFEHQTNTLNATSRHRALLAELRKQFTTQSQADDLRGTTLLTTLEQLLTAFMDDNEEQHVESIAELKRQANALVGETRNQTNVLAGAIGQQTNTLHGDNGWQSALLDRIASKDLSVSIHNVVNVAAQKADVDLNSNLR